MPLAPGTVTLEIRNRIGLLTLNQPEILNAMNAGMAAEFRDAIHGLQKTSEAKALVLTGAGRAFSAGGDLNLMKSMLGQDPAVYKGNIYGFYKSFLSIMELKIPTIAAVNGPAMGAGACVALACDIRFAASDSRIGFTFARIGLHPGMGAEFFLPRIVGRAKTCELLMTGDIIGADEALKIGLVNHVVPPEELMDRAMGLAERLAAMPALTIRMLKESIDAAIASDLEATLNREAAYQGMCHLTDDMREGVQAMMEKRPPRFKDEY
jgi:enoyl-CoA hydratase/carnithine racemase